MSDAVGGGVRSIVPSVERCADIVEPEKETFGIRDSSDDIHLAAAESGGADLIAGDTRDFTALRYGSIEVSTPRAFLDRFP